MGCIYRSPNSSILNDENLNTFLHMASSFQSHLLLAGDFNHPEINWREGISPRDPNHKATLFLEALRDAFLYQHVQNPTHYRHDQTANLLDLVFTNEEAMISEVQQLAPLGKSHHQVLNFSYTCYTVWKFESTETRYAYTKTDFAQLNLLLAGYEWSREMRNLDTDAAWKFFEDTLFDCTKRPPQW